MNPQTETIRTTAAALVVALLSITATACAQAPSDPLSLLTHPTEGGFDAERAGRAHRAYDFAGSPGDDILAMASGTVTKRPHGFNLHVRGGPLTFHYAYVRPSVEDGATVERGQAIGTIITYDLVPAAPHVHVEATAPGRCEEDGCDYWGQLPHGTNRYGYPVRLAPGGSQHNLITLAP